MSRQLPAKPNLQFLKKQAKELLRATPGSRLSGAQHKLANEYGFDTWAKLKSHVLSLGMSPAQAFQAAVCDQDAPKVRELLRKHPELRATINDPLPDYGFGLNA